MTSALTTYAELAAIIEHLPILVRARRRQDGLSLRQAAVVSGVNHTTMNRVENGELPNGTTMLCLLRWLDRATAS